MFHLVFSLPWLFVVTRGIWPLPWTPGAKIAVSLLLLIASQFHLCSRLSSGSVFNPEFPRPVVMLFNWLFGSVLLMAAFQLALDLEALVAMIVSPEAARSSPVWPRYAIGIASLMLAAFAVLQAVRTPPLKDVRIVIPHLPAPFIGYTLVQLTDLHISRLFTATWTRKVVDATNRLGADLIVVTGDVIDGSVASRRGAVEPLRDLRAPDGVFLIPGNHEYLSGYQEWMKHLTSLGMSALANAHTVIAREGGQIVIAGVTDHSARGAGKEPPNLDKALDGVPEAAPILLLDHAPRNAPRASERGVALQLSGHTHGGMVWVLDRIVARANGGFVSGAYMVGGMTLYVSNGTGIWPGFALRLGRPSELTRFTLVRTAGYGREVKI